MAQAQIERMTADEFFLWPAAQEEKYELADGVPVLHRLMEDGTERHAAIAGNIFRHLVSKPRGTPCRPQGSDFAILMDVVLHTRTETGDWQTARLKKPEEHLHLAGTEASLSAAAIYESLTLLPIAANG